MRAYKFLAEGATGVLSGFDWPVGEWVTVEGELVPTRRGVHACRRRDLSHWLDEELWEVELDGEVLEQERLVLARSGRLVERVDRWTPEVAAEFAHAAVERRADIPGLLDDVELWEWDPPSAAYMAAHAHALRAQDRGEGYDPAFDAERAWQSEWLARRLGLSPGR
jgi:hypothetical protein